MQTIIVGAGTVGFDLAVQLQNSGHDVGLVEKNPARCAAIREKLDILVVEGPGSSPRALIEAGLAEAQMVLAVTSVDEVNILVCGLAAQFGVETRIARVRNPEFTGRQARVDLGRLGVTRVIDPERIIVRVIHNIARIPDVVEIFSYHNDEILIAPSRPTLYPVLGKRAPIEDIYLFWFASDDDQAAIIEALESRAVRWTLLIDSAVDGREELRFRNTHPRVWEYLEANYERLRTPDLLIDHYLLRRRDG